MNHKKIISSVLLAGGILSAGYAFAASAYVFSVPLVSPYGLSGSMDMTTMCADGNCLSTTTTNTVPLQDAVLMPNTLFPLNPSSYASSSVRVGMAAQAPLPMQASGIADNMEMIVGLMQQFLDQQLQFLSGLFLITPGISHPQPTNPAPTPVPSQPVPANPAPTEPGNGTTTTPTQPIDQNPDQLY